MPSRIFKKWSLPSSPVSPLLFVKIQPHRVIRDTQNTQAYSKIHAFTCCPTLAWDSGKGTYYLLSHLCYWAPYGRGGSHLPLTLEHWTCNWNTEGTWCMNGWINSKIQQTLVWDVTSSISSYIASEKSTSLNTRFLTYKLWIVILVLSISQACKIFT